MAGVGRGIRSGGFGDGKRSGSKVWGSEPGRESRELRLWRQQVVAKAEGVAVRRVIDEVRVEHDLLEISFIIIAN